MRDFRMYKISEDMNVYFPSNEIKKIRLFNFDEGKIEFNLHSDKGLKNTVGTLKNVWIRLYDFESKYYDFMANDVYFDSNKNGLFLLLSEDAKFISLDVIVDMIVDSIENATIKRLTNIQYVERYTSLMVKEMKLAGKEILNLQQSALVTQSSRLDIEDTYDYARSKLVNKYLLNLVAASIIRENKEQIIEMVS